MKLSERLERLEMKSGVYRPELIPIPHDANLDQAMRIYEDNLRLLEKYPNPASSDTGMLLEEATRIYKGFEATL